MISRGTFNRKIKASGHSSFYRCDLRCFAKPLSLPLDGPILARRRANYCGRNDSANPKSRRSSPGWARGGGRACGQLQQRPEPKGGGIIKRAFWRLWESEVYPAFDFILACLDTAYTEST